MTVTTPLLLIGHGKMGGALLNGWLASGIDPKGIHIVSPSQVLGQNNQGCQTYNAADQLPADLNPAVTILAIKPQMMDSVLPDYVSRTQGSLLISIAAGKDIAYFQNLFGAEAKIVRVMPNTPSAVGRGISSLIAAPSVAPEDQKLAKNLMEAVGTAIWLDSESQMNAATAVAGSGPAYVFHLIEAMAAAGIAHGLSPALAHELARVTVCGAGELAWQSQENAAKLRQNVTSPGGVTAEALRVLMRDEDGLSTLMTEAVAANIRRSEELTEGS